MIEYKATVSNTEIPEIQGYKKQFSLNIPRGDNNKKEDTPVYDTEQVVEEPIVEEVITPTINEWSDIRAIIKKNEGFMDTAKTKFNEPSATVGYGFFDRLPDGTKITPGMRLSKAQADRQLDIALDKLSTRVRESLNKYNIQTSPEQFNILLDLGYHAGAGLVDKLLRESKGDTAKIGSLLLRYATTAKYGDTTITRGLKNRALRRSEGWNKYILKGKNGLKIPKFQNSGKLSFWSQLARQLQSAPSNGETTIAAHNADLNRQLEQAREEGRSEDEVYQRSLTGTTAGLGLGVAATYMPLIAKGIEFTGKAAMPSTFLKGVASYLPKTASTIAKVSPYLDAGALSLWSAEAGNAALNAAKEGNRGEATVYGVLSAIPAAMPLASKFTPKVVQGVKEAAKNVDNTLAIAKARATGKLKFGNPTTYTGIHQSNTPLTEVKFPFNRWDVTTHSADPNGFWLTLAETPNTEGTMASRPFASRWTATAQKPLIQNGEIEGHIKGKNNLRNAIVRYGKRKGADAFEFKGIKDNALPTTDVVMVTDKTNPTLVEHIAPLSKRDNFSNPDMRYGFSFNDDLPPAKWTYNPKVGNFEVNAPKKEWIEKGEELVGDYFWTPEEYDRLIKSGASPELANEIQGVRWVNTLNRKPSVFRNFGKWKFGESENIDGRIRIRYNSRKGQKASLEDPNTTLQTVFHELGGHGSSLNIGAGSQTIPEGQAPILTKILKHNESLHPKLRPFYQAVKDGDFELAAQLSKDINTEDLPKAINGNLNWKEIQNFIKYMEDTQEYSARAIGSNMSDHYGLNRGWNENQLRQYFTDESIDNLKKNVWLLGLPILGGAVAIEQNKKPNSN